MKTQTQTQSISMEYDLPHPAAKVWRALTEPALIAAWLIPIDLNPDGWQSMLERLGQVLAEGT